MAMKLDVRYPGRFSPATPSYPQGAFKNRSAPGAKDGSYLEKDWANDKEGFFGSLLRAAGISPNGNPDTALSSQYFDALSGLGLRQATELLAGVSKLSTLALALSGVDNSTTMTPAKVKAVVTALFPKRSFSANDFIRIPDVPGGLVIQWGVVESLKDDTFVRVTFAAPFVTAALIPMATPTYSGTVTQGNVLSAHVGALDKTGMSVGISTVSALSTSGAYWLAIGY